MSNNINDLINVRNSMLQKEKELYIATVQNINLGMKDILTQELGPSFAEAVFKDFCGEAVRRYFNTSSYYITVDQLCTRIIKFTYENDIDYLNGNQNIKNDFLNMCDTENMSQLKTVSDTIKNTQKELFAEDRATDKLDRAGRKFYHKEVDYDELTGRGEVKHIKGDREVSNLQADHIQPRNGATYSEKYIREEGIEKLKTFYNSPDNLQMMHGAANSSKGDIIICEDKDGTHVAINAKDVASYEKTHDTKLTNITYKCSAEEIADATIERLEKGEEGDNKIETLRREGYLDENGKVLPNVREKLIKNIKDSQYEESIQILEYTDYMQVAKDAGGIACQSIFKIITGQIIYYATPPVFYECKSLVAKKGMTLKKYIKELQKACKRIGKYIWSHLSDILENIGKNFTKNFIKIFFDLLIELVKGTLKKLLRIVKQLFMSIIKCIKTLFDSSKSETEKGDAITKILGVAITGIVAEVLFEAIKKGIGTWGIPSWLLEPFQILITVVATSGVMFILEDLDLFNVKYGLLVANIEKMFNEQNNNYLSASKDILEKGNKTIETQLQFIQKELDGIDESFSNINPYKDDVLPNLKRINDIFDMQIDFEQEWVEFVG